MTDLNVGLVLYVSLPYDLGRRADLLHLSPSHVSRDRTISVAAAAASHRTREGVLSLDGLWTVSAAPTPTQARGGDPGAWPLIRDIVRSGNLQWRQSLSNPSARAHELGNLLKHEGLVRSLHLTIWRILTNRAAFESLHPL